MKAVRTKWHIAIASLLLLPALIQLAAAAERMAVLDIWRAFQDDLEAARERYVDEMMTLVGVVVDTGMSRFMTPTVSLSEQAGGEVRAICVLPRADFARMYDYKPGQEAAFVGRIYSASGNDRPVIVKECRAAEL